MYLRELQKWQQLLILYINIVTFWCSFWESQMYSNNYQVFNSTSNGYNCMHTYACMLTFCGTAIIYYIIVNSACAFIKSTNMIYQTLPTKPNLSESLFPTSECLFPTKVLCKPTCCQYSNMSRAHFDPKAFEVSITNTVSNIYRNINKLLPNTIKYFTR